MYVKIRYQDGTIENVFAWLEPEVVLQNGERRPGWRVDTPARSFPKSEFFETALNEAGQREGTVSHADGLDSCEPFEWKLKGSETAFVTATMSSWVRKFGRFDPAGKPEALAGLDEGGRRRFDRHQQCWLHYLQDPAAMMEEIVATQERSRRAQERMDALDAMTRRYLYGWCAQFAAALHQRTGWTMYGIHGPGEYGEVPTHVVCRMPDGLYADVRGLGLSPEQICDGYVDRVDEFTLRPVSMSEMLARFRREPDALERAHRDIRAMWPSLDGTAPILAIVVEQDGFLYRMQDGKGGQLKLADLDLSEITEILGDVPELRDFSLDQERIEFRLDHEDEAKSARTLVAIGWIESMLVAVAEGAPVPKQGARYLTLPGAEIVAPDIW